MAGRTCESCGAAVPVLADACPACGADPELHLVEVDALAPLGRRARPASGPNPDDEGPRASKRSRWPLVALAAVVAVVVGVLVSAPSASSDDDEDAEDERAAEVEPTTTAAPDRGQEGAEGTEGPAGGEGDARPLLDTGLFVASNGGPVVLHLDTGHELPLHTVAMGAYEGRLLVDTGVGLAWWPAPFDGTGSELLAEGVGTGVVWIDPVDGGVWTLAFGLETRLVFIAPDGAITVDRPLEQLAPIGVAGGRLVLDGPGGTFTIGRDGATGLLSTGRPVAAAGGSVAVARCDETLVCGTELLDPSGNPTGRVLDSFEGFGAAQLSSTGRLATVSYDAGGVEAVFVDGEAVVDHPQPYVGSMAWSPDGRYLLVGTTDDIFVVDVETGSVVEVPVSSANLQSGSLIVFDAD